jgi:hypothetical protein
LEVDGDRPIHTHRRPAQTLHHLHLPSSWIRSCVGGKRDEGRRPVARFGAVQLTQRMPVAENG